MYAVFRFKGENLKIRKIYEDDVIARQTIVKRDSRSLGMGGNEVYILVEGSEEALRRAREIAGEFEIRDEEAEKVYKKIKEEEEEASLGMGAIFG